MPNRSLLHALPLVAGLVLAMSAQAESSIVSDASGALTATSRLDFRVVIPTMIFVRVGSGTPFTDNATVDRVDFNVPVADVGIGNPTAASAG